MKVLIVGDWHSELHEEPVLKALLALGHEVEAFKWHSFFPVKKAKNLDILSAIYKAQNKYLLGPLINKIQKELIKKVVKFKPDLIFYYRGTHIISRTLKIIKKTYPLCAQIGYNNDDPYAKGHPKYLWRHFLKALPEYDMVLAYRHANLSDYINSGAKKVELLRSWYVPERNYPLPYDQRQAVEFKTDIVFVGHYEDDGRVECLEAIVQAGHQLKLFGPGYDWNPILSKNQILKHLIPVRLVWGNDYNQAIASAKIALCFLSKLNRDTYTRRCFEIPASGTLLLSEYTDDLNSLFNQGIEADYFKNKEEMLEKIRFYLNHSEKLDQVTSNGLSRVRNDGHDIYSRMKLLINWTNSIRNEKLKYIEGGT